MHVDVKVTTWQRVEISNDATEKEVIDTIKNSSHFNLWDNEIATGYEALVDTEEEMTPEENGGAATIEVYNDEKACIWSNGE